MHGSLEGPATRGGLSRHLMSAYCMSSPLREGLGLLRSDKKQTHLSYATSSLVMKAELVSHMGYPSSPHIACVGLILATTQVLQDTINWCKLHFRRCTGAAEWTGSEYAVCPSLHLPDQVFKDKPI